MEADGSFPPNVTCKTAHALAYRHHGAPMRKRLNGPRMTGKQNAAVLGIASPLGLDADRCFSEAALASMALAMVARFCRSADPQLTDPPLPRAGGSNAARRERGRPVPSPIRAESLG